MKETLEIRVNYDFAHLLFKEEEEGRNLGDSVVGTCNLNQFTFVLKPLDK